MLLNDRRVAFLDVLRRMGAGVKVKVSAERMGEPVGSVEVEGKERLRGVVVGAAEVPALVDEIPALVAASAVAEGASRFEGLGELRHKESDRLLALAGLLSAFGVRHHVEEDGLVIEGPPARGPRRPRPRRDAGRSPHRHGRRRAWPAA